MTLMERLNEIENESTLVTVVYGNYRAMGLVEDIKKQIENVKAEDGETGIGELFCDYASNASAYGADPASLVFRVSDDAPDDAAVDEEGDGEGSSDGDDEDDEDEDDDEDDPPGEEDTSASDPESTVEDTIK